MEGAGAYGDKGGYAEVQNERQVQRGLSVCASSRFGCTAIFLSLTFAAEQVPCLCNGSISGPLLDVGCIFLYVFSLPTDCMKDEVETIWMFSSTFSSLNGMFYSMNRGFDPACGTGT